jgi:hypothetical protein
MDRIEQEEKEREIRKKNDIKETLRENKPKHTKSKSTIWI